ncbi:MAG: hypothetical protein DRN08_01825 [Thermoplasmata archaeon]|nr:MAG: hypothetical protein DRN08_01825 [Thermoplasmata archaeon]
MLNGKILIGITLLLLVVSMFSSNVDVVASKDMYEKKLCGDLEEMDISGSAKDSLLYMVRQSRLQYLREHEDVLSNNIGPYHSYEEMTDLLHELESNYSDTMMLSSLGRTYEGREIWMVKLSDDVEMDEEEEPDVLLMGAHHGNEKPSFEVLIYFIVHVVENYGRMNTDDDMDGLLNEDPIDGVDNDGDGMVDEDPSEDRVRDVVNNTEIYIIPMVNPDGVEAGTRKNRSPNHGPFGFRREITSYGVDLNRNYNYHWFFLYLFPGRYLGATHYDDRSNVYRGEYPFCESETRAVKRFVDTHSVVISVSYHTYGELILYPWGYTTRSPWDKDVFVSIGENISNINKYFLTQSVYLYPTLGDADDWLYGRKGVIAYTIELGRSYAPGDPEVVSEMCFTHVGVNLYVCEVSHSIFSYGKNCFGSH